MAIEKLEQKRTGELTEVEEVQKRYKTQIAMMETEY